MFIKAILTVFWEWWKNIPFLHSPVPAWRMMGKVPTWGYSYTICQTKKNKHWKKENKNKTRKTSNPRPFVEFPAISILFYHVALAEWLLNVIILSGLLQKNTKGNFPYPVCRNRYFNERIFWLFLYFIRGSWTLFKFSTVFN